jgi:hypothetical protein
MSQISITGASTGTATFTLESPATSTNRTITLADATGTMVVSGTTPSLNGITFPATQVASADVNTLDDYEEGNWTPTYLAASGTITTNSNTSGRYVKIGKTVYIWGYVSYESNSGASGNISVGGLPFTPGSGYGQGNNRSGGVFSIGNFSFLTNTPQYGNIEVGNTVILPFSPRSGSDLGFLRLTVADLDQRSNYSQFVFVGQYLV